MILFVSLLNCHYFQANDKAKLMTELDDVKSKSKKIEDSEEDLKHQMQGLHEAIKERDRNLAKMKEQVKYYVAFAEHSISNPKSQGKPPNYLIGYSFGGSLGGRDFQKKLTCKLNFQGDFRGS